MQTYFNPDPHIVEWADQVIEKTIAVSMLSGQNCDDDIQKIKSSLQKVLQTFLAEPDFTADNLKEIIKQLLEQRLPDPLVLEHIPGFYRMIDSLIDEVLAAEQAVPCLAPAPEVLTPAEPAIAIAGDPMDGLSAPPEAIDPEPELGPIAPCDEKNTDKKSAPSKPKWADGTRYLIKSMFPGAAIKWDFSIAGFNALAQADHLLLFLIQNQEEQGRIIAKLKKQGWFLAFCTEEDLLFPHRLERIIRRALRLSSLV